MDVMLLQNIFFAIKNDDVDAFSQIADSRHSALSLCFGRFPMLSTCYLFQSKSIIAKYEIELMNITNYIKVDEFNEIYKEFKRHAQKCMRFYIESDSIVSPLEMLAIINDAYTLRNVYGRYAKSEKIVSRLNDIYRILHAQNIKQEDNIIYIKKQKLPKKQAISIVAIILVTVIFTAMFASFYVLINDYYGIGTQEKPIVIRSEKQLKSMVSRGEAFFVLDKDMTIKEGYGEDFIGNLDGNGHTITFEHNFTNSFISLLSGTITNLNIVITPQSVNVEDNFAFLIDKNEGTLQNISVNIVAEIKEDVEKEELYTAIFCAENIGIISDSNINAAINCTGNGVGNAYFSLFAGVNSGTITRCSVNEETNVTADTVDLAGIAAENAEKGKISHCTNNGYMEQQTLSVQWNPNCAGITMTNYGLVNDCVNRSKIVSDSQADTTECSVYLGGIVSINNGKISKSKSIGELVAKSKNCQVYVGGIAAVNYAESATVESCGQEGILSIESPSQVSYMFIGGIVGWNAGTIKDCFFAGKMKADNEKVFRCYLVGLAALVSFSNNIALKEDSVQYWVLIAQFNTLYIYDQYSVILETMDEVKQSEVYW